MGRFKIFRNVGKKFVGSLLFVSACGGTNDELQLLERSQDGLIQCNPNTDLADVSDRVLYSTNEISELIRQRGLSGKIGLDAVHSCDEAARAMEALNDPANHGPEEPDLNQYPLESEPGDKIKNAAGTSVNSGYLEVVVGNGAPCSGSLLGWGTAITAAHCTTNVLNPANTSDVTVVASVRVSLFKPVGGWYCISAPTPTAGKCTVGRDMNVTMLGPYVGTGNTDSDISILMLPNTNWTNVSTADFLRVYTGSFVMFSSYITNGRGASSNDGSGAGTMRRGGFSNDQYYDYAFVTFAATGWPRWCGGDSGGPSTIINSGLNMMIGHTSKAGTSGACAADGAAQVGMRMHHASHGSKIEWVESYMYSVRGELCTRFSGELGNYVRCF